MLLGLKTKVKKKINTLLLFCQDITRIAHLVSKTVKSNVPCSDLGPEELLDINAVLSTVEDVIQPGEQSGDGQNNAGTELSGE